MDGLNPPRVRNHRDVFADRARAAFVPPENEAEAQRRVSDIKTAIAQIRDQLEDRTFEPDPEWERDARRALLHKNTEKQLLGEWLRVYQVDREQTNLDRWGKLNARLDILEAKINRILDLDFDH